MTDRIQHEVAALRRLALPRQRSADVAAARARVKRLLRSAGVYPPPDAPTWALAGLLRLGGVRQRLAPKQDRNQ